MPVRYVCKRCGYVLWEFKHVGQDCYGLPAPSEIIAFYGGICPRCKGELGKPTLRDITIMTRGAREEHESIIKDIGSIPSRSPGGVAGAESSYTAEAT